MKNYEGKLKYVEKLEWYVLNHDFNTDEVKPFNIFRSWKFTDCVKQLIDKYTTFEEFKKELESDLMWCFWSKAEYEIICSGLFSKNNDYKIDVYEQVIPNLDILARYIITEANKHKRKKLIID